MKKVLALSIIILLVIAFVPLHRTYADDLLEDEPFVEVLSNGVQSPKDSKPPVIDATSAIIMDMESGRVLFEKKAYTQRSIASTTKIMTAVLALEKGSLNDTVTVSKRAAAVWGSTIGLKEGQEWKFRDLLYGLLLSSGNDAAIAIAEHIGGSVENFADMMTGKARQIGAQNTCFKSPHGLDMDGHFSTAYDLALITRYALKNKTFSEIVGTKSSSIQNGSLCNTNEMLSAYPGADGVKTGYTGKAGRCLVASATRNGWRLISVVLGSPTRYKRALSSKLILDYAFNTFKPYTLLKTGEIVGRVEVYRGVDNIVDVAAAEGVRIPLKAIEYETLEKELYLPENLPAPVYAGVDTGTIRFMANGEVLFESKVKTCSDVVRKGPMDYLDDIFHIWLKMMREGVFVEQ